MKNLLHLIFAVAALGVVASCSSGTSSPGTAAKQYAEYMADGQYDKFIEAIYISPDVPADEAAQSKVMLRSLLEEKGAQTLAEKGGLKSVEILSEEVAEDGQTAIVELRYIYGNGETSDESMDLRLDGGKWLMELNKG